MSVETIGQNLSSPAVLFFALGLVATAVRSDLAIPEQIGRFLSLYLVAAIGFKGGVALREEGLTGELVATLTVGIALGLVLPLVAYALLRRTTRVSPVDAAAIGAHYGSVSVVTFLAATAFLDRADVFVPDYFAAVVAAMESPAILVGILIARRVETGGGSAREALREAFTSGSLVLLVGATAIGVIVGTRGMTDVEGFLVTPFYGILTLFLLDMGIVAGRRFASFRAAGLSLLVFGISMPLVGAAFGMVAGLAIGLDTGALTVLATLAASASYIAAPAAMRLAVPDANPSLSLGLALGVTFPFNVALGIPCYYAVAHWLT